MYKMNICDEKMFKFVLRSIRTWGPFEYLMAVFAASFNNEILPFIWTIGFLLVKINVGSLVVSIAIPITIYKISQFLKHKIKRQRPTPYQPRVEALKFEFRGLDTGFSMPSGDSAQAAAFWTFIYLNTRTNI